MANNLNLSNRVNNCSLLFSVIIIAFKHLECIKIAIYTEDLQLKFKACHRVNKYSIYCRKLKKNLIGIWKMIQISKKVSQNY